MKLRVGVDVQYKEGYGEDAFHCLQR